AADALCIMCLCFFFFSSRRRHTRLVSDWSSDVCSSDLVQPFSTSFPKLVEKGWTEVVHPEDLGRMLDRWQTALATGQPYENELRLRRAPDGAYHWHLTRAVPMTDKSGAVVKWVGSDIDIHDQKRAEEAQRFPGHAAAARGASAAGANLAVPRIGDWAAVEVVEDGRLHTLAIEHVDPKKVELAFELARRYPENPEAVEGPPLVLRTGRSELATEISDDR